MNTQVNQSKNMSNSDKIKMNINKKLSELSDTKLRYINLMFKLAQNKNPLVNEHICELIKLLKNAINIEKDPTLDELSVCFTSLMISYVFDINELICDQLDMTKYADRHEKLIRINNEVDYQIKNYNSYYLNEFKQTLLTV
jgi:hypothetical protein